MKAKISLCFGITFVFFSLSQLQAEVPPALQDKVTALKTSLQQNQANLRQYQWVETVTVSKGGDQKSQKQFNCYYGADGALQKVPVGDSDDQGDGGGRRGRLLGRIKENKKEAMADDMQDAMDLVKKYVPPQAPLIEAARAANNISPDLSGQGLGLTIQNYLLKGDFLKLTLDPATSEITTLSVNTYQDDPKDIVTLQVTFADLADGTSYPKQTVLTLKQEGLTVLTQNSGYRKM